MPYVNEVHIGLSLILSAGEKALDLRNLAMSNFVLFGQRYLFNDVQFWLTCSKSQKSTIVSTTFYFLEATEQITKNFVGFLEHLKRRKKSTAINFMKQGCRPWGCRGCHGTYLYQGGQIIST